MTCHGYSSVLSANHLLLERIIVTIERVRAALYEESIKSTRPTAIRLIHQLING